MSILASLSRAYDRLSDPPPIGFSCQDIQLFIILDRSGSIIGKPTPFDVSKKGTPINRAMEVPFFGDRTGKTPQPYFLWDNTAYILGLSKKKNYNPISRFAAFRDHHLSVLGSESDVGLLAVASFLKTWTPRFDFLPDEHLDLKIVFRLIDSDQFVHEGKAACSLWNQLYKPDTTTIQTCLVSGEKAPIARLHPSIKGVWGGQSSGGAIVSFNHDAFSSYGHSQGDNAPVSEIAAFKYTTTLNRFLQRDSGHRIQIGDASTVFWADASDPEAASEAESIFSQFLNPSDEGTSANKRIADKLEQIRTGRPLREIEPQLDGVRFHVLGLAPNAARLSIRFYFEDNFGVLTENYQRYLQDMAFEPWPEGRKLSISNSLLRTAPARVDSKGVKFDREQVSPLLSGELFRSILTGSKFPGSLLSLILMRVRSDHVLDSIRIALIKGVIVRNMRFEGRLPRRAEGTPREDYLVRSDPDDPNPARRAGRLFAVIERAQLAALGDNINSTVKDKFLGGAAATPQRVFPSILHNAENHIKRLRNGHSDASWIKDSSHARSVGAALARDIGRLAAGFTNGWPRQHSVEDQGLFLIGYYQERFGGKSDDSGRDAKPENSEENTLGEE